MAEAGLLLCAELGWVMDCHARLSARLCCSVVVVIRIPLTGFRFFLFAPPFSHLCLICVYSLERPLASLLVVCVMYKSGFLKNQRDMRRANGVSPPHRENKRRGVGKTQHHKPQRHTRPASPARTGHRAGRCGAAATARDAHAAGHTDAEAGLLGTFLFFKAQPQATRHVQCATLCSPRCRFSASLSRRSATERQHSLRAPSHGD